MKKTKKIVISKRFGGFGLSDEAKVWMRAHGYKGQANDYEVRRDHPVLVAVVEALGERASGRFAKLVVVSIPARRKFEIFEYDGYETVGPPQTLWG